MCNDPEDIIYEATNLGIKEEVFSELDKMKNKEKYKYSSQYEKMEKALNNVKNKLKNWRLSQTKSVNKNPK